MLKILPHYKGKPLEGNRIQLVSSEPERVVLPALLGGPTYSIYRLLIRTGLEAEIPEGRGLLIFGIPGLCHTRGITVIAPQILTAESFGEIKIIVSNYGATSHSIYPGDRIAEAVTIKLGD